jgi:hypothetical protein
LDDDQNTFASPKPVGSGLELKIDVSHTFFWPFEPIELDVEISLPATLSISALIPDEIDPGHQSFQIWITRPDGERFQFRSQTRFCHQNNEIVITSDKPYRCEIAFFRQSGGYTFGPSGQYQVQAALRLSTGEILLSNIAECEVLAADPYSACWTASKTILQTQEARTLLQHKCRLPPHYYYACLTQFVDKYARGETASAIHYALGKALIRSTAAIQNGPCAHELRRRSASHLRKAIESPNLSSFRVNTANELLNTLNV